MECVEIDRAGGVLSIGECQPHTHQILFAACVEKSVGQCGVCPHLQRQHLGLGCDPKTVRRGRCQDQTAILQHQQKRISRQGDRARLQTRIAPEHPAGRQLNAAQAWTVFLASVKPIEESVVVYAGRVMV
jgi:hypothetical protein